MDSVANNDSWSALLSGSRTALKEIYLEHHQSLFQYGMRMLSDEDATRDCLQNLFVKIWTNHKRLAYTNNTKYYLMSALRNEIINFRAKEQRHEHSNLNEEIFLLDFSVESAYIQKEENLEQTQRLADAMNLLTARQKEIIYLRYFEELDYDQIAEMMDITVKGAYKLSARALDALKHIMNVDKIVLLGMLISAKQYYHS